MERTEWDSAVLYTDRQDTSTPASLIAQASDGCRLPIQGLAISMVAISQSVASLSACTVMAWTEQVTQGCTVLYLYPEAALPSDSARMDPKQTCSTSSTTSRMHLCLGLPAALHGGAQRLIMLPLGAEADWPDPRSPCRKPTDPP